MVVMLSMTETEVEETLEIVRPTLFSMQNNYLARINNWYIVRFRHGKQGFRCSI